MSAASVATVVQMMESLPDSVQDQVIKRLSEYIEELRDELRWDESFKRSETKLAELARQAREDIRRGKAEPLNMDEL